MVFISEIIILQWILFKMLFYLFEKKLGISALVSSFWSGVIEVHQTDVCYFTCQNYSFTNELNVLLVFNKLFLVLHDVKEKSYFSVNMSRRSLKSCGMDPIVMTVEHATSEISLFVPVLKSIPVISGWNSAKLITEFAKFQYSLEYTRWNFINIIIMLINKN